MDKCSIFLIFFFNFIVREIAGDDKKNSTTDDQSTEVNFIKLALNVIGKKDTDKDIDWKAAFAQLAPICMRGLQNAATYEFLLTSRNHLLFTEDNFGDGMPAAEDEFIKQFKTDNRTAKISNETLKGKKHFKTWLWMLVRGSGNKMYAPMTTLRGLLNNDIQRFIWFASQIQGVFELISDDAKSFSFSPLIDLKHMKVQDIETYLKWLSPDIQNALRFFAKCEGWI